MILGRIGFGSSAMPLDPPHCRERSHRLHSILNELNGRMGRGFIMPARGLAFLLSCFLLLAVSMPVCSQDKAPHPVAEKKDAPPAKYERDGASQLVPWTLAAVGVIIVIILVCMPVRRD